MVIDRRRFFVACATATLASVMPTFGMQKRRPLPAGIGVEPDYDGPLPLSSLGTDPALADEVKTARLVMERAPAGVMPYQVAQYFLAVSRGEYDSEWIPYVKGWPVRWNPVIVELFRATSTKPEGDTTAWCAAFVNWCVLRGRGAAATGSASSGSFRCFGESSVEPRPGDIVVFKHVGDSGDCLGRGHVGFFVRDEGTHIVVLGGNQIEGHARSHMVSLKRLAKDGSVLKLHSIRTERQLHA
jgi:uncharacterized protein (TIGR02594 family)